MEGPARGCLAGLVSWKLGGGIVSTLLINECRWRCDDHHRPVSRIFEGKWPWSASVRLNGDVIYDASDAPHRLSQILSSRL